MNENDKKTIKQPPNLFEATQEIISQLDKIMGCPTLVYWTSDRGNVCDNDVVALYELFKKTGAREKIAMFIKSAGGDVEASLRIVNLIRNYYGHVTSLVPL